MSGLCQDTSLRAPFLLNSRKVLQCCIDESAYNTNNLNGERKLFVKQVDCIMVDPWEFLVRILKSASIYMSLCLLDDSLRGCQVHVLVEHC